MESFVTSVHPRIRGEHINTVRVVLSSFGSSPHTRGTRVLVEHAANLCRFIPAYAGNTAGRRSAFLVFPVHPRIRGEHLQRASTLFSDAGSSPHTRGTHKIAYLYTLLLRFIPACAGNTSLVQTVNAMLPVHPRIRGEHIRSWVLTRMGFGSSPHTRGTL